MYESEVFSSRSYSSYSTINNNLRSVTHIWCTHIIGVLKGGGGGGQGPPPPKIGYVVVNSRSDSDSDILFNISMYSIK